MRTSRILRSWGGGAITSSPSSRARNVRSTSAIDIVFRSPLSKGKTIAACKARCFRCRSLELVDHLAFGQARSKPSSTSEAGVLGEELQLDLAKTDFAGEGVVAAVAALRGIAEREQEALVGARQVSAAGGRGSAGKAERFGASKSPTRCIRVDLWRRPRSGRRGRECRWTPRHRPRRPVRGRGGPRARDHRRVAGPAGRWV